jgi:prepilin-type N-terminal cleavage/methylation domain-containing protein
MSMRNSERGFTLVESLIAAAILVPGLVAVAMVFPYVITTNVSSRQTTTASMIAAEKMEALRTIPLADGRLNVGGSLNPATPATGYYDYVTVAPGGAITSSVIIAASARSRAYLRLWQVAGTNPKTVTVVVYTLENGYWRGLLEATRSSTIVTDTY